MILISVEFKLTLGKHIFLFLLELKAIPMILVGILASSYMFAFTCISWQREKIDDEKGAEKMDALKRLVLPGCFGDWKGKKERVQGGSRKGGTRVGSTWGLGEQRR